MPNTESAKKRLRQSLVNRDRNRAVKSSLRTALRKLREDVANNQLEQAQQRRQQTARLLDKAAAKGVIHANKASRLKSRISHLVRNAQQAS
ncbi:MAG: 30S ribosomal protein S20 [Pirellulaceae bacterium]|nr:30S ribosomal protein S20 [Pirellulaceae bacterium]